jgi:methionyl-tRNA formyltransferase
LKIIFAGTPAFAASHLSALASPDSGHEILSVVTQPDKPGKRGKKPIPSPVKELAIELGLPILQPTRITANDLAPLNPDLLIVVAYGQILKDAVLKVPTLGCINVHGSLLPRWRGAAPIQRAIMAGDDETGICIMKMDAGLDTGDVLLTERVLIRPDDTSASLAEKLTHCGQQALLKGLAQIEEGSAIFTPQVEEGMTYAKKLKKEEGEIDWHDSALSIARRINAFNPDPVAYTFLDDLRIKIWHAEASSSNKSGRPGEIIELSKAGLWVACGEGAILISRIQLPLGKGAILNGQDVLNARKDLLVPGLNFSSAS